MATPIRRVIVDDTSADIHYIGDWFTDIGSLDTSGNYGTPFLSTSHGTNTSASLALNFIGSSVTVFGTTPIYNVSGPDPQWSCYVDGVAIFVDQPARYTVSTNNWRFCYSDSLKDGPHTITVNATVANNQTFWFDHITYRPSASLSLENKTIYVPSGDSAIQLGTGWNDYYNMGYWTQKQGALLALNFYGTSISWYGHIPGNMSSGSTTASWVIDDKPPQVFILKGPTTNCGCSTESYDQKFFETPLYPYGSHTLTVTYNGDSSKTALVLGLLVIKNGTSTTGSTLSPTQTTSTSSKAPSPSPAIVGGVIGGVACLLIVVLLFFLYRRRRLQAKGTRATIQDEPADHVPIPHTSITPDAYDSPSQSDAKGHPNPIYLHPPGPNGPSPINMTTDISGRVELAGPSSFVDSGIRFPQVMPLPPAYTPD